jgi:predicted Ser/Thr protein kinase
MANELADSQIEKIEQAMGHLSRNISEVEQRQTLSLYEYLEEATANPKTIIRNIFQVFHDMIKTYVGEGEDEYPDDPESIQYVFYDCSRLFVEGADRPFFADRLFANRLVSLVEAWKRGAQQNKIYIFKGPPGCGKSTFLNNLLKKFEEYTHTEAGTRYETVWRFNRDVVSDEWNGDTDPAIERLLKIMGSSSEEAHHLFHRRNSIYSDGQYFEVPCPSHDNPILMIPKPYRRAFLDDFLKNDEFKWKLLTEKEYEWVFKDVSCTICTSLYQALLNRLQNPLEVFKMIYARPYLFNRRIGEGISVFNPGDKPMRQTVLSNAILQQRIDGVLKDSNKVQYIFSRYAKTNNGIYALMDIKTHNVERMIELHNIISEGVHKVEDIEENVNSLLLAIMNPEDEKNFKDFQSFSDRIEYVNVPYVMDLNTEVEIYLNIFGRHISESFLPRVLHNFARVIISSRLNVRSDALLEWIGDSEKYKLYCDPNLQLLKMEIYTGYIPTWLSDDDRQRLTAKRRRTILAESEKEGEHGISGRDSIKLFNEFYSAYARVDKLINMSDLCNFFNKARREVKDAIPEGFLNSLLRMYNYTVLQEVKESLYYYNEKIISRDIQNYLFAVNFEPGAVETCSYTGQKLEITEDFWKSIEYRFFASQIDENKRRRFRQETQKEYTTTALPQEILMEGKDITDTKLYQALHERYVYSLKEKVLDPFLLNENFRRAIKDYGLEDFKTYDKKIRDDVTFLIHNLENKYRYTPQGAKEVCIYVIDNDLAQKFASG